MSYIPAKDGLIFFLWPNREMMLSLLDEDGYRPEEIVDWTTEYMVVGWRVNDSSGHAMPVIFAGDLEEGDIDRNWFVLDGTQIINSIGEIVGDGGIEKAKAHVLRVAQQVANEMREDRGGKNLQLVSE